MRVLAWLFCFVGILPSVQAQVGFAESLFKSTKHGTVLIAAHRGGYSNDKEDGAPENSVANVNLAIEKGYDVFETDIQRTSDGVFVIVHDATLDRETNGSGAARDLTLAELKTLKKRFRDGSLSQERVATLEELLLAGKDRILFKPDLKPGVIEHFEELAKLISKLQMTDQVFLRTRFSDATVIKQCFADGCPKVEVMFKVKQAVQVKRVVEEFHPKTIQIDVTKGEVVSSQVAEAIREAVRSGVLVETHVYGDPVQSQKLAELGVRMFHTASPDRMLDYLKVNGWRKGQTGPQQSN